MTFPATNPAIIGSNPAALADAVYADLVALGTQPTPMAIIDLKGAILVAGTPLGAFTGTTPGCTVDQSKAVGIRWHGGTLTTVWTKVDVPLDLDPTYPVLATFLCEKVGTTATDLVSVTVACYAQTVGALEDAAANTGAATPAFTTAQAGVSKAVVKLQAPIYVPPTPPAQLTVSITPTGTLATDDLVITGAWLEYTRRPAAARVSVDFRAGILAAGTPLAAWANNAGASAPGVTLNNSKVLGVKWNNQATLTAVWSKFILPGDFDVTKPCVVVALVSKSGATGADTMTLDVGIYEQVPGALEDATTNLGGVTSAIAAPTATAKTVAKLTLGIAPNTFTQALEQVSMSLKPTDGTLGTDDGVVESVWIEYTRKSASANPVHAFELDFKAGMLVAGTPMAAWASNASSNPGVTLNNSKAVGVKWNNAATQTAVWSERDLPLTFDYEQAATLTLLVSKSGITAADLTTFTAAMYQQTVGSLSDAGSSFTGTTTAVSSATVAAKTISKLTLKIPAKTFAAQPGRLSVSLKPTDGSAGTDDVLLCGAYVEFAPRLALLG